MNPIWRQILFFDSLESVNPNTDKINAERRRQKKRLKRMKNREATKKQNDSSLSLSK